MRTGGYEHLPLVRKAFSAIHSRIKPSSISSDWPNFETPSWQRGKIEDEILFVQRLAKAVAAHYRLHDHTFIVGVNSRLSAAAQIEVRANHEIFLEYSPSRIQFVSELWAIMAHELAHIFLDRIGLRFRETLENEVLTDTTAIYLGFGCTVLSAQDQITRHNVDGGKTTTTKVFGYLSPDEMGYVLAQRDYIRGENSHDTIRSQMGKVGYLNGKARFEDSTKHRPYCKRSLTDRVIHRLGWIRAQERDGIVFSCKICGQDLRIPALRKELFVTCSSCGQKHRCFS